MHWLQFAMDLNELEPDSVEAALNSIGALSISFCDAGAEAILEPAPGSTPLWKRIRVSALLPGSMTQAELTRQLNARLEITAQVLEFTQIEDRDWQAEWQQTLKPMQFGKRLWIYPWPPPPSDPGTVAIHLEPGLAFGTGEHPTTAMCMQWLADNSVEHRSILDFGCGSGVLAIAALALGADSATAVDIDEQAQQATRRNAERNACEASLRVLPAAELRSDDRYDVVLANILSGTLMNLSPTLESCTAAGGDLVLSGVLADQAGDVCRAYHDWISLSVDGDTDGWVLLTGRRVT